MMYPANVPAQAMPQPYMMYGGVPYYSDPSVIMSSILINPSSSVIGPSSGQHPMMNFSNMYNQGMPAFQGYDAMIYNEEVKMRQVNL